MHKLVVERLFTRCQDMQGKITSFIVIQVIDSVVAESKKIAFLCSNKSLSIIFVNMHLISIL